MIELVRGGVCIGLTVTLSGCSFLFVDGPPPVRSGALIPASATCTNSTAVPVLDGAAGLISGVVAALGFTYHPKNKSFREQSRVDNARILGLAGLGGAALYLVSAADGSLKVATCREFLATPVGSPTSPAADSLGWAPSVWGPTPAGRPLVPGRR